MIVWRRCTAGDSPLLRAIAISLLLATPLSAAPVGAAEQAGQPAAPHGRAREVIEQKMHDLGIPGVQYAIVKAGRVTEHGSLGVANVEDQVAVTDSTVFWINSCTKAFVGVAIMQLVEEGKVDLDGQASAYLDDYPRHWPGVTVRQLLSHSSGLPDMLDGFGNLIAVDDSATWAAVKSASVESAPGTRFRYNLTNYVLLGRIIERASGQPYDRFIVERQLRPLGMVRTIEAGFSDAHDIVPRSARVYTYFRSIAGREVRTGKLHPTFEEFSPATRTATGMQSTALELARWLIALQNGQLLRKPASLETLWTPMVLKSGSPAGFSDFLNGYALGWPTVLRARHPAVAAVGGGRSAFFVYRKDDTSVIVLTNLRGASPEMFIDEVAFAAF